MDTTADYFFCGVGGSGMAPLAAILRARGATVSGSDRALDQGRSSSKFDYLRSLGIKLFPQDGSGITSADQVLVASAAIEDTVPDVAAALSNGCIRKTRAETLAALFNTSPISIGVAGTSGKSTTTAMIAWILSDAGQDPTVMNGAVMKNFVSPKAPYASAKVGDGDVFVSEIDESDGSISLFNPTISVLNNISHDHKSMDELRALFSDFIDKAETAVVNADDVEARSLLERLSKKHTTYSQRGSSADFIATNIERGPITVSFSIDHAQTGETAPVLLKMPGDHNVSNALAAVAAATAVGVPFEKACAALSSFDGVARRFDIVGSANGVTVIDDFAHNPDKIQATISTLKAHPGRVLVVFQPHGFGPLKKLRSGFVEAFSTSLSSDDHLWMTDPAYFGGTADRSVSSEDVVRDLVAEGIRAIKGDDRTHVLKDLVASAKEGDRIIVMG
ncbi:MAG: Mur ligase family protein, partial [Pseudomonadota bacterium]